MAKVFLNPNDSFIVSNNKTIVYGSSDIGLEIGIVTTGTVGLVFDQNVEAVKFGLPYSDYRYWQTGNQLQIYDKTGSSLIATITVQGDSDGSQLSCYDGTVNVKLEAGVMTLGGAVVSNTAPGEVTPFIFEPGIGPDYPPAFSVSVEANSAVEGGNAVFMVTLSKPYYLATSVSYNLSATGGAVLGVDAGVPSFSGYGISASSSSITFAAGSTVAFVSVPVLPDSISEVGEGLRLALSYPVTPAGVELSSTSTTTATIALMDTTVSAGTITTSGNFAEPEIALLGASGAVCAVF